ncbi:MAG TPA: SRPBCC domain-containing protein, partial [Dehalococcoidia bacterium]|nr:SRPBCC domain-containing protein [Dehalococcoidia bacterium]
MVSTASTSSQAYQVFIKATPERIWDAITRPEFTSRYFYGTHVEAELRPGGAFRYYSPDRSSLMNDGTVLES